MLPAQVRVKKMLIWHQGALGDLLLAGPALKALHEHYAGAAIIGVGHPKRWGLLPGTLPLEAVWDSGEALWAHLFLPETPLPEALTQRLASIQLAVVFSPRPKATLLSRLSQAGIPQTAWLPSFPMESREAVSVLQARHLTELGLKYEPEPFHLSWDHSQEEILLSGPLGNPPIMAMAPGSGHPCKNWPLAHYIEVSRALAWQHGLEVVWLAGPAETSWLPYVKGLTKALGHYLLFNQPLGQVAKVLAKSHMYLGGDSGITHLAAAAGARRVLALFGPTDPKIWAPPGEQVTVLTAPGECVPCTQGREIPCDMPQCLPDLSPQEVFRVASNLIEPSLPRAR